MTENTSLGAQKVRHRTSKYSGWGPGPSNEHSARCGHRHVGESNMDSRTRPGAGRCFLRNSLLTFALVVSARTDNSSAALRPGQHGQGTVDPPLPWRVVLGIALTLCSRRRVFGAACVERCVPEGPDEKIASGRPSGGGCPLAGAAARPRSSSIFVDTYGFLARSSNGRTAAFGAVSGGSNPPRAAATSMPRVAAPAACHSARPAPRFPHPPPPAPRPGNTTARRPPIFSRFSRPCEADP